VTDIETDRHLTRGHFPSRDKDGGHTIGSAIPKNPVLHANFMALSFSEPELRATKVYIARIGILYLFVPVTLTLKR